MRGCAWAGERGGGEGYDGWCVCVCDSVQGGSVGKDGMSVHVGRNEWACGEGVRGVVPGGLCGGWPGVAGV